MLMVLSLTILWENSIPLSFSNRCDKTKQLRVLLFFHDYLFIHFRVIFQIYFSSKIVQYMTENIQHPALLATLLLSSVRFLFKGAFHIFCPNMDYYTHCTWLCNLPDNKHTLTVTITLFPKILLIQRPFLSRWLAEVRWVLKLKFVKFNLFSCEVSRN